MNFCARLSGADGGIAITTRARSVHERNFVAIMRSRMRLGRVILGWRASLLMAAMGASQDSTRQDPATQAAPARTSSQNDNLPSAPSAARIKTAPPPACSTGSGGRAQRRRLPRRPLPNRRRRAPREPGQIWELPPDADPTATIRQRVNEVPVVFTVTDRHGHYVKDLQRSDFQILDNNQPPAASPQFSAVRPTCRWKSVCWWMPATRCATASASSRIPRLSS